MKDKIIGFGDFLLRLNPEEYLRFSQADRMQTYFTGAEANVCVSLRCMGMKTEFVTRVPDNDIARAGLGQLSKYRVGLEHVALGGERLGVFYVEKGASQRPSKVIYDRKYSAICTASPTDFCWPEILRDAAWLHVTGITPALGGDLPRICQEALQTAKQMGVTVSCDLNYRQKLWSPQEAGTVMRRLLPYVDVLIANEEDCARVLGISAPDTDVEAGRLSRAGYIAVARQVCREFPNLKAVGVTLRGSVSASDNDWAAMLYQDGTGYFSRQYRMHIVDRVGGGDSFAAGLIYAKMHDLDAQTAIEYAAAASCLKHSIEMDYNLSTAEEIWALAKGNGSGRVQR